MHWRRAVGLIIEPLWRGAGDQTTGHHIKSLYGHHKVRSKYISSLVLNTHTLGLDWRQPDIYDNIISYGVTHCDIVFIPRWRKRGDSSPWMCCGSKRCCRWRRRASGSPGDDSAERRQQRRQRTGARLIGWDLTSALVNTRVGECGRYHGRVFHQRHVVAAERHHEQHRPDILEATDPLPALRPLAANVVHPVHRGSKRVRPIGTRNWAEEGGVVGFKSQTTN